MQNLIRMALKCFFLKYYKNCPAVRNLPPDPSLWYALVATVFSVRCPIETFFKQKVSIFRLIKPPSPLNKIQVAVNSVAKGAKGA